MIDLRPGAYTVTFTLAGFNTGKREGVALSGSAASVVDVDLRVGSLEETITVTGESPTVDVSTTSRSAVLSAETIDALPTSRNYASLARMIPAAVFNGTDVGGSAFQGTGGSVQIHGSRAAGPARDAQRHQHDDAAGGRQHRRTDSRRPARASEVTVDHTAVSAELPTGGVRINFIPRDGGNRFAAGHLLHLHQRRPGQQQLHRRAEGGGADDAERGEEELGPQRLGRRTDQARQAVVLVLSRATSARKAGRRWPRT